MIENHMVIGDYYTDGKVSRAERMDEIIRDAKFERSWDWLDWVESRGMMQELLSDIAHELLNARDPREGGIEARAVLERCIEDFAEEAVREES